MAGKGKSKKKDNLIRLISTGTKEDGVRTGTFKTTVRISRKNVNPRKLSKKCFDPKAYNPETGKKGMHVLFEEAKIK